MQLARDLVAQHRLAALATTGVLVLGLTTAVTWRAPERLLPDGDRTPAEAVLDHLATIDVAVEQATGGGTGLAAGAASLRTVTGDGLAGLRRTTVLGGVDRAAGGDPDANARQGATTGRGGTTTTLPGGGAGGSGGSGGGGAPAHDGGDGGLDVPPELQERVDGLLWLVDTHLGRVPGADAVLAALGTATEDGLRATAGAVAGADLAAATAAVGTAADTLTTTLVGLAAVAGTTVPDDETGPLGEVADEVVAAVTALDGAVRRHREALTALTTLPAPTVPELHGVPLALADEVDAYRDAVGAVLAARLTAAVDAATAAGEVVGQDAAALAWDAAAALEAAAALAPTDADADAVDRRAADLVAEQVAGAEETATRLERDLVAAAGTVGGLHAVTGRLATQLCATAGCDAPVLTTPDEVGGPPPATTPGEPATVDLVTLYDAADADGDGDLDADDLVGLAAGPAVVHAAIVEAGDVDGDGDLDADDTASLVLHTPAAAVVPTAATRLAELVATLDGVLTSLGPLPAAAAGDELVVAAQGLLASADGDGDGTVDADGLVGVLAPGAAVATVVLHAEDALAQGADRTARVRGCGQAVTDGAGAVPLDRHAALTLLELAERCERSRVAALRGAVAVLTDRLGPACGPSCEEAVGRAADDAHADVATALAAAADGLLTTLDVTGDGAVDGDDAAAWGDPALRTLAEEMLAAVASVEDVTGDAFAAGLVDTLPTTADRVVAASTLRDATARLLLGFDGDGDGDLSLDEAARAAVGGTTRLAASVGDATPTAPASPAPVGALPSLPDSGALPDVAAAAAPPVPDEPTAATAAAAPSTERRAGQPGGTGADDDGTDEQSVGRAPEVVRDAAEQATGTVDDVVDTATDAVDTALDDVVDTATDAVDDVTTALDEVVGGAVGGLFGG